MPTITATSGCGAGGSAGTGGSGVAAQVAAGSKQALGWREGAAIITVAAAGAAANRVRIRIVGFTRLPPGLVASQHSAA